MRNHQGYPQGFQQRTPVQRALLISLPTLLTHRCSSASPLLHCSSSGSVCQIDQRRPETPRPAAFAAGVLRLDTCGLRRPSSAEAALGLAREPTSDLTSKGRASGCAVQRVLLARIGAARGSDAQARCGHTPCGRSGAEEAQPEARRQWKRVHAPTIACRPLSARSSATSGH